MKHLLFSVKMLATALLFFTALQASAQTTRVEFESLYSVNPSSIQSSSTFGWTDGTGVGDGSDKNLKCICNIQNGNTLTYDNIQFSGQSTITLQLACVYNYVSGRIKIHLNTINGPLLGVVTPLPLTQSWSSFEPFTATLSGVPPEGTGSIVFVCEAVTEAPAYTNQGLCNLDWFELSSPASFTDHIAIASTGTKSVEYYHGNLMITKPAASAQYINLTRLAPDDSFTWSIGTLYNTNTFAIGKATDREDQFTNPYFTITNGGNVGIGTDSPDSLLTVKGFIHARGVLIDMSGALVPDFVFHPSYKLMPLKQVEQFVKINNHLPEIPSASEVSKNGINMGEMQNKLLQKIEELTLYLIEQQKRIETLEKNQK